MISEHISISVVSHGHGRQVLNLLDQIDASYASLHDSALERPKLDVFVTLNAPELDVHYKPALLSARKFTLRLIENEIPLGFGTNHNRAFSKAKPGMFVVLNPDIALPPSVTGAGDRGPDWLQSVMSKLMGHSTAGLAYVAQGLPSGEALDFERELVTPWSLILRYFHWGSHRLGSIEWVSGSFMAFPSEVFAELGGFDERYFMYCEDVDICLRLQLAGYSMVRADVTLIHDTQRNTFKDWQHLRWHVRSLFRLWFSTTFWSFLMRR
jgi:hypothetical protein